MDDLTEKTEKSLQMNARLVVWITLLVAAMGIVGSIAFLILQYPPAIEIAKPENRRLVTLVKVDEFLKHFESTGNSSSGKIFEDEVSLSSKTRISAKYLDEAKKIVACSRESNSKSGLDISAFTPQLAETFQHELQRVADSQREQRGVSYVADAVRFFCEVVTKAEVIAYKRSNSEVQLFDAVINYHLTHWDQVKEDSVRFGQEENQRVLTAIAREKLSASTAQFGTFGAFCVLGVAFGLLLLAALYFVLARIELTVHRAYRMLEALNLNTLKLTADSEFSKLPLAHLPPDAPVADSTVQGTQ